MTDLTVWMYVSRSTLRPGTSEAGIDEIVRWSRTYNMANDVTGMLLFTGTRFAQLIEGPTAAIDRLSRSITADRRHHDLTLLSPAPRVGRRFAQWSLGYGGPSRFVRAAVEQTLEGSGRELAARTENLARLMIEFAV